MEPDASQRVHSPEITPGVASKELIRKHSSELMRLLREKNNPGQPYYNSLWRRRRSNGNIK